MKTYTLHLLRHGLTDANIQGKYVGVTDVSLSEKGLEQLEHLKATYQYNQPQLIFSSPLKRCKQTINKIFGDVNIITVDGLKECNMGIFEGKTNEELKGNKVFEDWVLNGTKPPKGESSDDFAQRVCAAFNETVQQILTSGKTESLICAHGGVIMTILGSFGIPQRNLIDWMANNGRGFTIRITPSLWMRTGAVEVISEYPYGSGDEPDLGINPLRQAGYSGGNFDYFNVGVKE